MTPDPYFVADADGVPQPRVVTDLTLWDPDQPCDTCEAWQDDTPGCDIAYCLECSPDENRVPCERHKSHANSFDGLLDAYPNHCDGTCCRDCIGGRRTAPIVKPCADCVATPDGRRWLDREDMEVHPSWGCCAAGDNVPVRNRCVDGWIDTGERCSWTLAPVIAWDAPETAEPHFRYWPDLGGNCTGHNIDHLADGFDIQGDVSPGDVVAVPGVTP